MNFHLILSNFLYLNIIVDSDERIEFYYGTFNIDYGTFNYADPSDATMHNSYDMTPFKNQYKGQYTFKYYVSGLGSIIPSFRPNSYYWNKDFVIIQRF